MRSSELERVERLAAIFGAAGASEAAPGAAVLLGIGDDAAVLAPCPEPLVWTVDAAVEGTHFRREWLSFEDIGYRSTMAAASDLAAMAAAPLGVLSGLVLPDDVGDAEMAAIARGQQEAVTALGAAVVGGNLARGRELSITTTVLGRAPSPLLRRGARPGDALWLVGPVGLAAAGLRLLMEGRPIDDEAAAACVRAWRRPRARIAAGLALRGVAVAAIDVSDGLARDVGHLARASHTAAIIDVRLLENAAFPDDASALPEGALRAAAERLGVDAARLALFGGEDYALAVAAADGALIEGGVKIGAFEESPTARGCVIARWADGSREVLPEGGFDHFAR